MAKTGKRTTAAKAAFADKHDVTVEEAVALIKDNSKTKFDETVEIAMNLGAPGGEGNDQLRPRRDDDAPFTRYMSGELFAGACAIVTEDGPLSPNLGWRP